METNIRMRKANSFARRHGKSSTNFGKQIFAEHIDKYAFSFNDVNASNNNILEIGFGMGDNIINLAQYYQNYTIYGAEPFIDGHIRCIRASIEQNLNNIRLHPDDFKLLEPEKFHSLFDKIFVLFPDPWPKKRHTKRRLLTKEFIKTLMNLLKNDGNLTIASDHAEYQIWIEEILNTLFGNNYIKTKDFPAHYKPTKYHEKALATGNEEIYFYNIIK